MTTPNEELRRLATAAMRAPDSTSRLIDLERACTPSIILALLDQLQSQAERIAELESLNELAVKQAETLVKQRDTLRAELKAIAATEPVLVVEKEPDYWSGGHFHEGSKPHIKPTKVWCLPIGTQLFTHPMPAESKDAERYRWLRDYLISPSTHFDDLIVSADKADTLDGVIDAAIAKGAK